MVEQLQRGRERYSQRAWRDAWRALSLADQASALEGRDLELLATAAYLIGRGDDYLSALARAHHAYLDTGERRRAVRCAFWLGLQLLLQGERGRGTGWLARAQRVLEGERAECPEHGYLMLPAGEQQLYAGDFDRAYDTAVRATSIGDRFREPDLLACALHLQGRALLGQGEIERGLALLDEAMIAVSAGELSPLMTGLVYCSVIGACRQVYALDRSQQWTDALARWCDEQPDMVAFTESCLVHRAEVKQLHGAWQDALDEAARACERFSKGIDQVLPVAAFYQIAEVLRLRGDFRAAEEAYRTASRRGWEPQPGLALLRLAQGRREVAAAAIRRVATAATDRLQRIDLLPAYLEIMLAVDDLTEARAACRELEEMAETLGADVVRAMAAHARGAVELAAGVPDAAVAPLRFAMQAWQRLRAPYEAARVRELLGAACRILGDDEGAELELDAARSAFEQLGAMPDLARLDALRTPAARPSGLTARELQVLRLIAAGKTNKAIAADLGLSEKTIERHVSNIFNKLNVATRAAATACAYENKLI